MTPVSTVLHITTFLQGGAGRVLVDLACAQKRRGQTVLVVADNTPVSGYETYPAYRMRLEDAGIPFLEISGLFKRNLALNLAAAELVRNLIHKWNINLVHTNTAIPAMVALLARGNRSYFLPVLLTMQGWGTNKSPEQAETDVSIMNLADAVVPVSNSSAKLLRELGVVNPFMEVIYNAVPQKEIISQNCPDDVVFRKLKEWRKKNSPIIGCIGSVGERKNQKCLLQAMSLLPDPKPACLFVGEEETPGLLNEMARSLELEDRILLAGYRNDVAALSAHFTCIVLPSRSEGLPLAIIEALRDGIPVIGSDIPSIREIVADNVNGKLFRDNDPVDLAFVLQEFLSADFTDKARWIESGKKKYAEEFHFNVMLEKYDSIYKKVHKNPSFCV